MTHEKNFGSADATVVAPQTLSGLSGVASVAAHVQCRRFYEDLPGLFRCIDCGGAS